MNLLPLQRLYKIDRLASAALQSSSSAEAKLGLKVAEAERVSVAQSRRISELANELVKERRHHQAVRAQ
jgi:hypothetical protein